MKNLCQKKDRRISAEFFQQEKFVHDSNFCKRATKTLLKNYNINIFGGQNNLIYDICLPSFYRNALGNATLFALLLQFVV